MQIRHQMRINERDSHTWMGMCGLNSLTWMASYGNMVYGTLLKSSATRFMATFLPSCWSILDDPLMERRSSMHIQSMPMATSPEMKDLHTRA